MITGVNIQDREITEIRLDMEIEHENGEGYGCTCIILMRHNQTNQDVDWCFWDNPDEVPNRHELEDELWEYLLNHIIYDELNLSI